ncbi:MAG: tRNA glutamyl-Q(34) synthetase GluQRS [Gammaproteobacteria bacterium]|nr:tRNA glutamyl-Q(34) synthetase GluQRS [Gammaproteobacteria bacterium]
MFDDLSQVCGRFAPSPTGPLHFGSLVAATASYLNARHRDGRWLLRMEDIDQPRVVPSAADSILFTLEQFGFTWDGEVCYQSRRHPLYREALQMLQQQQCCYYCDCTRSKVAQWLQQRGAPPQSPYPGICRNKQAGEVATDAAIRLKVESEAITFNDQVQGRYSSHPDALLGDYLLRRRDAIFAYHLVVVVDDLQQGVTEVVRGGDLLEMTPQQIYLRNLLTTKGEPALDYAHIPVMTDLQGEKLGKQTAAPGLDPKRPGEQIWRALQRLGQQPPLELLGAEPAALWAWAIINWKLTKVPQCRSLPYDATLERREPRVRD